MPFQVAIVLQFSVSRNTEIQNVRENGKSGEKRAALFKCLRLPCFDKITQRPDRNLGNNSTHAVYCSCTISYTDFFFWFLKKSAFQQSTICPSPFSIQNLDNCQNCCRAQWDEIRGIARSFWARLNVKMSLPHART